MSVSKLGSIENVNRDTPLAKSAEETPQRDPRVMDAAKMYERHFLNEMVKAMRATVHEGDFTKSTMADKIYKDQLDGQYVEQWTEAGGIGLAEMIHDELMGKIAAHNERKKNAFAPKGPLQLSDRDVSRVLRAPSSIPNQTAMRVELKADATQTGPAHVTTPWDAKVLTTTRVDGKSTILLEHEGGIRSAVIFDGVLTPVKPGDSLKKGTQIGVLSPEIRSFFWNLNASKPMSVETADNSAKFSGPDNATGNTELPRKE